MEGKNETRESDLNSTRHAQVSRFNITLPPLFSWILRFSRIAESIGVLSLGHRQRFEKFQRAKGEKGYDGGGGGGGDDEEETLY